MIIHDHFIILFVFIIYFFAKLNNVCRVYLPLILLVPNISHSFVLLLKTLGIWVCHMKTFLLRGHITCSSGLGERRSHDGEIFFVLRFDHGSTITRPCITSQSWISLESSVHSIILFE